MKSERTRSAEGTVCVILNYNDADTTISLVNELRESGELRALVIVDNCSTDDSWERLRVLEDGGRVFVLRTERNGGYGSGNQAGIDFAVERFSPAYLMIANPDIHVDDRCIRRVREALECQEDGAVASARVKNPAGKELFSYWDLLPFWRDLLDTGLVTRRLFRRFLLTPPGRLAHAQDPRGRLVGALPGSFFLLKTACFSGRELRELFDPAVFLYYEEKILARKLERRGLREVLAADVSYVHAHSVSIDRSVAGIAAKQRLLHESKLYYYRRYLGCGSLRLAAARLFLAVVLAEVRFLTGVVGMRW